MAEVMASLSLTILPGTGALELDAVCELFVPVQPAKQSASREKMIPGFRIMRVPPVPPLPANDCYIIFE